jgi:hypothetical protein
MIALCDASKCQLCGVFPNCFSPKFNHNPTRRVVELFCFDEFTQVIEENPLGAKLLTGPLYNYI